MSEPARKKQGASARTGAGARASAKVIRDHRMKERARLAGHFDVKCWETRPVTLFGRVKEIGLLKTLQERSKFFSNRDARHALTISPFHVHRVKTRLKWEKNFDNRVVDEGCNYALDAALSGGTPITSWFIGLTDGAPVTDAAGDTLASHAGWSEANPYAGNRLAWTDGGVSAKSVDNVGNEASFSINATDTVGGCFLCSVNTGTSGTLYSVGAFTGGDESVSSGDTLEVTYTATIDDDAV